MEDAEIVMGQLMEFDEAGMDLEEIHSDLQSCIFKLRRRGILPETQTLLLRAVEQVVLSANRRMSGIGT